MVGIARSRVSVTSAALAFSRGITPAITTAAITRITTIAIHTACPDRGRSGGRDTSGCGGIRVSSISIVGLLVNRRIYWTYVRSFRFRKADPRSLLLARIVDKTKENRHEKQRRSRGEKQSPNHRAPQWCIFL